MNLIVKTRLQEEWLTTAELAAYTGWSTASIKQKAHRGTIDSVKKGGILLFWKGDFLPEPPSREPGKYPGKRY